MFTKLLGGIRVEQKITEIIVHMSHSHGQMARVIDAERQIAVRMSQIVHAIPDSTPGFEGTEGLIENAGRVNKSVISYLNAIADLQEAMAESLGFVMKEMRSPDEE
jgi:methyl-accepting chemotaxis protein